MTHSVKQFVNFISDNWQICLFMLSTLITGFGIIIYGLWRMAIDGEFFES